MSRRSLDHTLKLLKELDRAASVPEVVGIVRGQLAGFGVDAVIAALLPEAVALRSFDRRFLVMENVDEAWRRVYLGQHYAADDPIVRETLDRTTGFGWDDPDLRPVRERRAAQIMSEAAEIGLRQGYTVPLTTLEGAPGGMTFAGDRLEIDPAHRGMLTLLASYAFGQALLVRGHGPAGRGVLSPRERETLQWTAEGKTDWEIGELMGISQHGADFHLRSARVKLGCVTRTQAVAEGLRRGLIV